jgi:hypothetical protein
MITERLQDILLSQNVHLNLPAHARALPARGDRAAPRSRHAHAPDSPVLPFWPRPASKPSTRTLQYMLTGSAAPWPHALVHAMSTAFHRAPGR